MKSRARQCDPVVLAGRARKARQFADAFQIVFEFADQPGDVADACATLAVHAGIAAADVICCARLGRHSTSDNHQDALALLSVADPDRAKHLRALLGMKTRAGYSHEALALPDLKKAKRAMEGLLTGLADAPTR